MSGDKPKTAAELMAELEADPGWVERRDIREHAHRRRVAQNGRRAEPVLKAVTHATGIEVTSLAELRESTSPDAVAVLIELLPRVENVDVKCDTAAALAGEWARPVAAAPLVAEFEAAVTGQGGDGLRWTIASALSEVADCSVTPDLLRLVQDPANGDARKMLALALGRSGDIAV